MQDLTQGSIPGHLIRMAIPMAMGMFIQTLYFLVDLYFVGGLGEHALAGVSAAGNVAMLIMALTQIINVGTATLIAHAVGRKDKEDANQIFNQSLLLAFVLTLVTLIAGYGLSQSYMQAMSDDAMVVELGKTYLYWFLPNLAMQFCLVAAGAALRGTGIVKPAMLVQMLTVVINIILAPILISGWLTGYAMGVAGAGLASTLAMLVGLLAMGYYFYRLEHYVSFQPSRWKPQLASIKRLLSVGFPAGAEFLLIFIYMALIYWAIQGFGASATAGFGLGSRVMQAMFLPAMAVAFALPAVAGQNFGAQQFERVRDSFKWSLILSSGLMAALTLLCLWQPLWLVDSFSQDETVLLVSTGFLSIICLNFIPTGIIFSCSGSFQGLGNTWPGLLSAATRLLTFALPVIWLTGQAGFYIEQIWYLSVVTVVLQSLFSAFLVKQQFAKRLIYQTV